MKYAEIRGQIKTGDIIGVTHHGWKTLADVGSQIVRVFTRSEFSHVGITFVYANRVWVLEAVIPEIRIVPLSVYKEFAWVKMPNGLTDEAVEFAISLVGVGEYSVWECVKAFFSKNILDANWECAEYAQWVLKVSGTNITCKATPADIIRCALDEHHGVQYWVTV